MEVTKLKAFADDKLNIIKMAISLLDRVENSVGKGENAGFQQFLLFPPCLSKPSSLTLLKVRIVWYSLFFHLICKCFEFGPIQKLSFGKELSHYHTMQSFNDPDKVIF